MDDAMTVEEREQEEPKATAGPTRHAKIMRGVVTPIFGLAAVACIALGVLNATIWKPEREIRAETSVSDTRYVVTDPGVLGQIDDTVSMTVNSDDADATVCVATGSMKDVTGWLSGNPYVRITGLSDWTTLSTNRAMPQGADLSSDDDVAFADSDMWLTVACDTGEVTLDTTDEDSSHVALVDFGANKASGTVSMHWVRQSVPDFAMPLYFVGGLLIVLAVMSASVFAVTPDRRRKQTVDTADDAASEPTPGMGPGNPVARPAGRHGRHRQSRSTDETDTTSMPTIVDPSARNLVSDQMHADTDAEPAAETTAATTTVDTAAPSESEESVGETTSVISADELAAYFARFAQENASMDDVSSEPASDNDPTTTDDATDDKEGE